MKLNPTKSLKPLILSAMIALTQAPSTSFAVPTTTPCSAQSSQVRIINESAKTNAETVILDNANEQQKMVKQAMTCLQRIKDLLAQVAVPTFPDLTTASISTILNWLSDKACQVIVGKVTRAIPTFPNIAPITTIPGGPSITPGTTNVGGVLSGNYSYGTGAANFGTNAGNYAQSQVTAATNKVTNTVTTIQNIPSTVQGAANAGNTVWQQLGCSFGGKCQ